MAMLIEVEGWNCKDEMQCEDGRGGCGGGGGGGGRKSRGQGWPRGSGRERGPVEC